MQAGAARARVAGAALCCYLPAMPEAAPVGFIGLGTMGEPMALNLVKAGMPLLVWNRSPARCRKLGEAGAAVAKDAGEIFARCEAVIIATHYVNDVAAQGVQFQRPLCPLTGAGRVQGRQMVLDTAF